MKRVADAGEPVVVVPIVVVTVDIDLALAVPPVEDRIAFVQDSFCATAPRISRS